MGGWKLFMTRESGFCQRSLCRYGAGGHDRCPKSGYHNAEVVIDPQFLSDRSIHDVTEMGVSQYKDDVRWPKECACGYVFHPEDYWQVNIDRLYAGALDGKLYRLRDLPPGAVWRATWIEDANCHHYGNAKGEVWAVQMPNMVEFLIFQKDNEGRGWDVTGELPKITLSPSINQVGSYHGYIQDGVISEDCEGRPFKGLARTS